MKEKKQNSSCLREENKSLTNAADQVIAVMLCISKTSGNGWGAENPGSKLKML